MKIARILFSIFILVLIIGVIAISCLLIFVDPNKLKPLIIQEVKRQTGYQLVIDGKMSWTFYPQFAIKVPHMTLSSEGHAPPFADLHQVAIAVEWSPLLHGNKKLQGNIYIADAVLLKLHIHHARVGLHWQKEVLSLQPILGSLYKGSLEGVLYADHFPAAPRWKWDIQFENIQLKPLLQDVNGPDSSVKVAGVGTVKLQAVAIGKSSAAILQNLNGIGEFNINNGVVEGINFNYLVRMADAILNKQSLPAADNIDHTEFTSLTGVMAIKNGDVRVDNLLLQSSDFSIKGEGDVNLVSQNIDYHLQMVPLPTAKTQWTIPVLISDNIHHPQVRVDMATLNSMIIKTQVDKVKTKIHEEIKQLPDNANRILQHILGG